MKPITTRGPAQAARRNGNSGDRRQGAEITGALLAAATRPDPDVAEKPVPRQNCVRLAWRRSVLLGEAQHAGRLDRRLVRRGSPHLQAISPRIKR